MTHFPDPLSLPASIIKAREQRNRQVLFSVICGVGIRSIIVLVEFIGGAFFGSSSLLMDALSSSVDVLFSLLLILFIKLAERPPDWNHPFGHGRYEPLAGLQLGLFLALIGVGMLIQQTLKLTTEIPASPLDSRLWLIPIGAVILLEICYVIVMRVAKKQNSPALVADAAHYRVDSITSLFAAAALLFAAYFPQWSDLFDHFGAILIALLMVGMGLYAVRDNLHQLLDRVPAKQYFENVHLSAMRVEGVRDTEKIRIQQYGPDAHVDIDIEVDPMLPVKVAHAISQKVRLEIQKEWPAVRDVTVHIEPYYPNDHKRLES